MYKRQSQRNLCGIHDSRRFRETFLDGASRADCVKVAINYVVQMCIRDSYREGTLTAERVNFTKMYVILSQQKHRICLVKCQVVPAPVIVVHHCTPLLLAIVSFPIVVTQQIDTNTCACALPFT